MSRRIGEDVVMLLAIPLGAWVGGTWGTILAAGAAAAIVWAFVTLHFPSRVEMDDEAIRFSAYGRSHVFAWRDVARVHVRRFLVRDRVLVRLAPATAWRGRYWLTDGLAGYDALVAELEKRARQRLSPD